MPTFGEVIDEKGISARKLAKDLGISVTSIPTWKYKSTPRASIRDRIERYFGVEGIVFGYDVKEEKKPKNGNPLHFKDLMDAKGISIRQMAKDIGFSATSISSWRRFKSPSKGARKIIEGYLKVTGVIFGGDDGDVVDVEAKLKPKRRILEKTKESGLPVKEKTPPAETVTLTASEEYVLMSVIKKIGFDEALRRLVR